MDPDRRAILQCSRHCIAIVRRLRRSGPRPGGPSTPNCQRDLVLGRLAAVGVEQVALVEHGVGDRSGRGQSTARS